MRAKHMEALQRLTQQHDVMREAGISAACAGDTRFIHDDPTVMLEAAVLCRTCPIQQACADVARWEAHGVWGGKVRTYYDALTRKRHVEPKAAA